MGQYIQFIKKDHKFDFLKVQGDNFAEVDSIIESKDLRKLALPNYILKKIIKNAKDLKISISSIEFYGEISQDLQENINELIEQKNYEELLNIINETKLNIRKIQFYDIKVKKFSTLFSNGIAWIEDKHIIKSVLDNII